jgi:3-oxoacyl-[acyl-carrier protein] reductase
MHESTDGGRIVVVTGGAGGIGLQIALKFAGEGDIVVIFDLDGAAGDQAAGEMKKLKLQAYFCKTDVATKDSVRASVDWTKQQFGGIDVLVNCAGILDVGPIEELEESLWDRVIDVNLKGSFLVMQAVIPCMKGRPNGRIINISSLAGRMGGIRTGPAYSASKAGMIGLTKAVARMVAPHEITVNAVAPSTTNTEMAQQFSDRDRDEILASIPMARFVETDEIAEAVFFLASEKAGMITGVVLDINGGAFMA